MSNANASSKDSSDVVKASGSSVEGSASRVSGCDSSDDSLRIPLRGFNFLSQQEVSQERPIQRLPLHASQTQENIYQAQYKGSQEQQRQMSLQMLPQPHFGFSQSLQNRQAQLNNNRIVNGTYHTPFAQTHNIYNDTQNQYGMSASQIHGASVQSYAQPSNKEYEGHHKRKRKFYGFHKALMNTSVTPQINHTPRVGNLTNFNFHPHSDDGSSIPSIEDNASKYNIFPPTEQRRSDRARYSLPIERSNANMEPEQPTRVDFGPETDKYDNYFQMSQFPTANTPVSSQSWLRQTTTFPVVTSDDTTSNEMMSSALNKVEFKLKSTNNKDEAVILDSIMSMNTLQSEDKGQLAHRAASHSNMSNMSLSSASASASAKAQEKSNKNSDADASMTSQDQRQPSSESSSNAGNVSSAFKRIRWTENDMLLLWKSIAKHGNDWTDVYEYVSKHASSYENITSRTYHQVKDKGRRLLQQNRWHTGRFKQDYDGACEEAKEIANVVLISLENKTKVEVEQRAS